MAIINKTGITNGGTIQAEHVTNLYDTFNGTGSFDVIATGSFTGSFRGDGSQLTGIVSSKWTGSNPISRNGDVTVTGSMIVTNTLHTKILQKAPGTIILYIQSDDLLQIQASSSITLQTPIIELSANVDRFDLSQIGDADRGFILPQAEPQNPARGSMYYDRNLNFYIHDGTVWRTGSLT
jgi:hypothetical protein